MTPIQSPPRPRICLVGAADDTGNLGVSALMWSLVAGLARSTAVPDLTVFDNGRGWREDVATFGPSVLPFHRFGMWPSRRLHRPESLWNLRTSAACGGLRNRGARALLGADAVWDISGGDSFGDLYGELRWRMITDPKKLVLRRGRPLVLLPQTYGPFRTADHRSQAAAIVRSASAAWARDPDSFEILRDLVGDADFDPVRHRLGVDVAFGLPVEEPRTLPDSLRTWLEGALDAPIVGINVSGLVYNDPEAARRYGLTVDYRQFVLRLVNELLARDCRVLLIPHVLGEGPESDRVACQDVAERVLEADPGARLTTVSAQLNPMQAKWLISHLDWFLGTRMHSTIAGLSTGVPTTTLAYSLKARGVFATCGLADQVVDGRTTDSVEAVERAVTSFDDRASLRERLTTTASRVTAQAQAQLTEFVQVSVEGDADAHLSVGGGSDG